MTSIDLVKYKKQLTKEELDFLKKKESSDKQVLWRAARGLLILCFVCPFFVAWIRALLGAENPFSLFYYFLAVFFLMFLSGIGLYWSYTQHLQKIQKDIASGTKTVEKTLITRKQFMPTAGTYHVYTESPVKISIEVTEEDYRSFHPGDTVFITYSTHSLQYFGYF